MQPAEARLSLLHSERLANYRLGEFGRTPMRSAELSLLVCEAVHARHLGDVQRAATPPLPLRNLHTSKQV